MLNVNVNIVVLSTDIPNKKKYVLSTQKETIKFPKLQVDKQNKKDIEKSICEFIRKDYLFLSDIEILPQFISFNADSLCDEEEASLEIVYGSIVPLESQKNDNNCHWVEFNILDENNPESYLLINVIRSLL